MSAGGETGLARPMLRSRTVLFTATLALVSLTYIAPLFLTDPSLVWASADETCCHVRAIRAIQQEGLVQALGDYRRYRSATTPLYHIVMAMALDRVDPLVIRFVWIAVTFAVTVLFYRYVRADRALRHGESAAAALALAFVLSPTIRAAAVYFVTDGLAIHLAIAALVLLRRAHAGRERSPTLAASAVVVAFASFYTRQYYVWVTLYVAYCVFSEAPTRLARIATSFGCVVLALPAIALFSLWHGFTPPLGTPVHTEAALLSTAPNALALLAVYSIPLASIALTNSAREVGPERKATRVWMLLVLTGLVFYVAGALAVGAEVPRRGGIFQLLSKFGATGTTVFLVISYIGLLMLVRWLAVDGLRQLWWVVFLLPLLTGSFLLQRYFEPAVIVFMFLVARPRDALNALDSKLVWFYPLFTALYAGLRTIYFA